MTITPNNPAGAIRDTYWQLSAMSDEARNLTAALRRRAVSHGRAAGSRDVDSPAAEASRDALWELQARIEQLISHVTAEAGGFVPTPVVPWAAL